MLSIISAIQSSSPTVPMGGSRGQSQHQRGHGQQEEHVLPTERVVAYAQVGDDGPDIEYDETDCGGRSDRWYTDAYADQQSDRARYFKGAQYEQPRFLHAHLGHGDEEPLRADRGDEVDRGREDVSDGGQDTDNDVGGEHGIHDFLNLLVGERSSLEP